MTVTREYVEVGGLWQRRYLVVIRGNGEVTFRCKVGVKELGKPERWKIQREQSARLFENIRESGLLEKSRTVGAAVHNMSGHSASTSTSLTIGGVTKVVKRNIGSDTLSPEEESLRGLERQIEETAGVEQRIRECCFQGSTDPLP
jgi:hypothetical protein